MFRRARHLLSHFQYNLGLMSSVAAIPEDLLGRSVDFLQDRLGVQPKVGVILGSGFGPVADKLQGARKLPYGEIPGFLPASVAGHAGCVYSGRWAGVPVMMLAGRAHYYEGHSMAQTTFPIRVFKKLGIKTAVLTAAVGSTRKDFRPASLVLVQDHINNMGENPLRGPHLPEAPHRFTDLTNTYTPELRALALKAAKKAKVKLLQGVHVATPGPTYETPAEVRSYRKLGGDTVGMSLVPEAIMARYIDMRVLAILGVSNYAAGVVKAPLTHDEVLVKVGESLAGLGRLLDAMMPDLA